MSNYVFFSDLNKRLIRNLHPKGSTECELLDWLENAEAEIISLRKMANQYLPSRLKFTDSELRNPQESRHARHAQR